MDSKASWWQDDLAKSQKERFDELNSAGRVNKAECLEHCPKCDNDRLMFWTMQTRSADEGEAVFTEGCVAPPSPETGLGGAKWPAPYMRHPPSLGCWRSICHHILFQCLGF